MSKGIKIFLGIIIGIWLLSTISSLMSHKSVAKKLDDNPNFEYSTSLTSNYDRSDKAKIYSSDMSVKETALYLIAEDRPEEYTDLDNEEAIQLTYDDYYVLIYEGEDGKTYTQISSRKYIHNNGYNGLYRPYGNNIVLFYHTGYTSSRYYNKDNRRYGNGYSSRPVKNVNTTSSTSHTSTITESTKPKQDTDSNKIKTDKNSSNKIRTQNSKTNSSSNTINSTSTKGNSSSTNSASTKSNSSSTKGSSVSSSSSSKSSTSTKSSSSRTKSVRSSSVGSRSRVGGGTSFGK
jgi:hypothetical protein